jgi:UDP:flavonoid glycosyltransferase YjiC (YdhE family)
MSDAPTVGPPFPRRPRVLFLAEAVTLAHVARPVTLARSLDPTAYEVCLAAHPRYNAVFGDLPFPLRPIQSIPVEQFLGALARGAPVYDADTLSAYVEEDLAVLRAFRPDVVVGDFRLSLAVSARLAGVRYLTITNAYWSPYARQRFPLPDLPLTRRLGVPLARALFRLARPLAFALHARPLNAVRRRYGLPSLGRDLRRVYTEADEVLYADVPELVPTFDLPANHHYLGPVLWSPAVALPAWWDHVPGDRPVVYVTPGSSGRSDVLALVLRALADLPVSVLAATAGRVRLGEAPANAFVADYLPGEAAAAQARLVVCNGGSPTTQQALAAGTPVLGIAGNMDHYLNMGYVRRAGAGEVLRAGTVTEKAVRTAARRLLEDARAASAARHLSAVLGCYPAPARFAAILGRSTAVAARPRAWSQAAEGG